MCTQVISEDFEIMCLTYVSQEGDIAMMAQYLTIDGEDTMDTQFLGPINRVSSRSFPMYQEYDFTGMSMTHIILAWVENLIDELGFDVMYECSNYYQPYYQLEIETAEGDLYREYMSLDEALDVIMKQNPDAIYNV